MHKTTPFTSLIPIAGVLITLSFLLGVLALLADMMGRHRKISEELLYLARRRVYSSKRTVRVSLPPVPEESKQGMSLHDSWSFPVIREIPIGAGEGGDAGVARRERQGAVAWKRRRTSPEVS